MGFIAELENVKKSFGEIVALDGLNLQIQKGEIFGLVGPNGAGKTTTVRMLLGLLKPTAGVVRVFGESVSDHHGHEKGRVGVVLESPGLYLDLSVEQNIAFFAKLYGVGNWRDPMRSALDFMGLRERRSDPARKLSKGMKQKVALARALVLEPDLLILDEPTSGIDPIFQSDLRQKILSLAHQGKTVFLCSHNMAEVEEVCSRIAVINHGHLVAEGSIGEIAASFESRCFKIGLSPEVEGFLDSGASFQSVGVMKRTSVQNEFRVMLNEGFQIEDLVGELTSREIAVVPVEPFGAGVADVVETILVKDDFR